MMLYIRQCNGKESFGIKIGERYYPFSFASAIFMYRYLEADEIVRKYVSLTFEQLGGMIIYIEPIDEVQNELSVDAG